MRCLPAICFSPGLPGRFNSSDLTPASHGRIYSWIHSTDIWGTDRNTRLFPQADGFIEFLESLFNDEQQSDLADWRRPFYHQLARELEL